MNTRTVRTQLDRLRKELPEREVDAHPIVSIHPDQWPADSAAAYWEADANGDDEERRRIIREQTGQEVSRRPNGVNLIVIRRAVRPEAGEVA